MKKYLLTLLFAFIATVAYPFEYDGMYFRITDSDYQKCAVTYKERTAYGYHSDYSGDIKIPDYVVYNGNFYNVTGIDNYAFSSCYDLLSVTLPNSIESIGFCAFEDCNKLTTITIPQNVKDIYSNCFRGCASLETIFVDNENEAFTSEDGVLFDKEKTRILTYPAGKTGDYVIPNTVTNIDKAFQTCSKLTGIVIPSSVTTITSKTFEYCSSLTNIALPQGVTAIESEAFYNCDGIQTLTLPNSLKSIGEKAFLWCSSLQTVINYSRQPPVTSSNSFTTFCDMHVIAGCKSAYMTDANWQRFNIIDDLALSIESITLDKNTYYCGVGKTGQAIATTTPDTAGDGDILWKSSDENVLYVDKFTGLYLGRMNGMASITAYSVANPDIKAEAQVIVGDGLGTNPCDMPTIVYDNGKIKFACETENATIHYNLITPESKQATGTEFEIPNTYEISVYASANGFVDSEYNYATLVFDLPISEEVIVGINNIETKPILVTCKNGLIQIYGLEGIKEVKYYSVTNNHNLGSSSVHEGYTAYRNFFEEGEIIIIHYGDKSIKIKNHNNQY